MTNKMTKQNLQLYLHIPFCVRKCAYCDFLSGPASSEEIASYVDAMICEIKSYRRQFAEYEVSTVFLGGGTPSILTAAQIEGVFSALRETFDISVDAEISIEMNPGTVTKEKLEMYRKVGINRLSIGLQSVNDEELKLLGRIHTMQEFLNTYRMARDCGFENVNVDLISAIPGQTVESWKRTLQTVAELKPEHISAYSLIVEEGTPFYEMYGEHTQSGCVSSEKKIPSEEDDRRIYKETIKLLKKYNYERYEISNYAKPGFACRHNLGYWERENYLGIGTGASSLIQNERFHHISNRDDYVKYVMDGKLQEIVEQSDIERVDQQAQMEEFMFLGLRKMEGVSKEKFYETFGKELEEVYGTVIDKLMQEKLIEERQTNMLALTEQGIDISNYVMSEFLL